ncbi:MAG TPA: RtcB family protein [Tepidisphaeraceae bacterium]|jgi:tRNA-splicing ligase RtcB|nr:RtcB family protein [Tepidisphaeraceae bacterium]
MNGGEAASMFMWLGEPLETPVARALERIRRFEDVAHVAVMPDVHLAKDVCVGTVIATNRLLYPAAVGGDIGCGMLAMGFDIEADTLKDPKIAGLILRDLCERIPGVRRHRRHTISMPHDFGERSLSYPSLAAIARDEGTLQLGTLGGGNHFVELQADEENRLWLMIHSGSRAMGQAIRGFHLARGFPTDQKMIALDAATDFGKAYLNDVEWARAYASANRDAMGQIVTEIIAERLRGVLDETATIRCDHNHVALEAHFGKSVMVHRKGAMPADIGKPGVVPGSMGTLSYHVTGKGCTKALRSSAHGAGRRFSRAQARQTYRANDLKYQMGTVWFDPRLTDQLRDESPRAYKDVRMVLKAQNELIDRVRTLKPVLVYKGV